MALNVSIGQYYPGDSLLHRLDPRCKLACTLVLMFTAFTVVTPWQLACTALMVACLMALSGVPARATLASTAPILAFVSVMALFNLFFVRTGDVLVDVGFVHITDGGVWAAVLYSCRFALLLLVGALLLLTTTPTALTDGFERAMSPLARLGAPVHEIALIMSLALRFVPTLATEAQQIMDAQAARGGGFEEDGALTRLHAIVPMLVPLFAGAIRHAEDLSRALDARCYEGGEGRTHYHQLAFTATDVVACVATVAYVALLIALGTL